MNNGRLQLVTTWAAAVFTAGAIYTRISFNAAAMRADMLEIRKEQQALAEKLEILIRK